MQKEHLEILLEDIRGKLDLYLEMLADTCKEMREDTRILSKKVDTEAHHGGVYLVKES
jgi:hypothetical protein